MSAPPAHRRPLPGPPPRPYTPGSYMLVRDPEALRAAKEARRLTYRQLALLADVHPSTLSHLIPAPGTKPRNRTCTPETARRIAHALLPDLTPTQAVHELFEHRYASDPSTGDLPVYREDLAPATAPLPVPTVTPLGARGKHRRKVQP